MTRTHPDIRATLLYAVKPHIDLEGIGERLNAALLQMGLPSGEISRRSDTGVSFKSRDVEISVGIAASPLGAACFTGAIAPDSAAATRATLIRAVTHHDAHVGIQACAMASGPLTASLARNLARLVHQTADEIALQSTPLALYWSPTNRLHTAERTLRLLQAETPLELFLHFTNESHGPRRLPGLRVEGAPTWLQSDLYVRIRPIMRATAIQAVLAFVRSAMADPAVMWNQTFHHGDTAFRIAHDPNGHRIEMIPLGSLPTIAKGSNPTTEDLMVSATV